MHNFLLHFLVSGNIVLIVYVILLTLNVKDSEFLPNLEIAIKISILIGIGKEIFDYYDYGSGLQLASGDLLSNVLGIIFITVVLIIQENNNNNNIKY